MCGIAGIIGDITNNDLIHSMAAAQSHRGPDYTGFWKNENISLAHNRLSIIDLEAHSNQPLVSNCGNYILVFNGEIYNYIELKKELNYNFKTNSDTEVLLAAYIEWGKKCLHKLNGMFSFAIWDVKKETLFAARDRFGVKPFFYTKIDNKLIFSSEIKAIHAYGINKTPNKKVWANYFAFGSYGMPNETFWKDISQLSGGHYLEYSNKNLKVEKWYFFEKEIKKYQKKYTYEEVKTKYTNLLKQSIRLRFRADVAVGFNLSGGLDSSALLTFVNQQENSENIKAFTFYTNDKRYDELPWVEEMISITNNPLVKVLLKSDEVENLSKKVAYHQDEPFGGIPTLAYAKIFEQARKENILVLLDGQGMDEQWAGYDYYLKNENTNIIQGVNKSPFKKEVLSKEFLAFAEKPKYPKPFEDDLLNKQYRDLFYTKIPRALRFNDRVSMASSTELREPFLDYNLVEFAFAQPLDYKIKNGIQKKVLRDIVSEFLSDSITYAPKRPLQTPQREWLGNDLKDFVSNKLDEIENSSFSNWFDMNKLKKEWQNYLEVDNDSSFHIWQWLSLAFILKESSN
ncbi:asparagine synthase (glutamine-hydrolyzing) [Polaribacter aestuariivivens]|uniref:asparagine synthase (glutamine-hydrolyzing) n=1 Tax=Polaribacter aestuariivivens TaxID=2304626 RepID=A0A5S3N7Q6_9FLAO|nr:asparagine synthase (glutamine-hydrolyzing) [Polaribacter aestuariivivens]TMM31343.1 asparagine synthase (glutamine-hydrolyzing) [Polaribacter aestuariivivens]